MHIRDSERSGSKALTQITPLILTYNEEANINRTLEGLSWAQRIMVVDSGSTDRTLELLAAFPQVEVVHRPFDSHANQWNAGLALIQEGWVLSLDADYLISGELWDEMSAATDEADRDEISGYYIPFRYCVHGKPLRGTVLPPRLALFRRECGCYVDDGHTQRLRLRGACGRLINPILHDDRKPLSRWLWAQERYQKLEAAKLLRTPNAQLSLPDRIRKRKIIAPIAVLAVCLFWHRGLLDGWRGWFYAFQRMYAELLLSLMLWEAQQHDHA